MCDRGEGVFIGRYLSHPYPVPGTVNIGERRLLQFSEPGSLYG